MWTTAIAEGFYGLHSTVVLAQMDAVTGGNKLKSDDEVSTNALKQLFFSTEGGIGQIVYVTIKFLLTIAPMILFFSWVFACGMFVLGSINQRYVDIAKDQMKRTIVATMIIGGYFVIRKIMLVLAPGE